MLVYIDTHVMYYLNRICKINTHATFKKLLFTLQCCISCVQSLSWQWSWPHSGTCSIIWAFVIIYRWKIWKIWYSPYLPPQYDDVVCHWCSVMKLSVVQSGKLLSCSLYLHSISLSLSPAFNKISWLRAITISVKPIRSCHSLCEPQVSLLSLHKSSLHTLR